MQLETGSKSQTLQNTYPHCCGIVDGRSRDDTVFVTSISSVSHSQVGVRRERPNICPYLNADIWRGSWRRGELAFADCDDIGEGLDPY